MPTLLPFARSCLLASCLAVAGAQAEPALQVAELILDSGPATPAAAAKATAQTQREKAEALYKGHPSTIVVEPDDEDGVLSPRGGAPAQERAFEQRWRGRVLRDSSTKPITPELPLGPVPTQLQNARDTNARLRSRGAAYTGSGNWHDLDLSHRDKEGLPLVNCHSIDNVSGRIGDDTASGSTVFLIRNGQQIKVRCR
ncbi:hypothetical protein [Giesbergeria anulus]|uniref:Uncharacterized protein n=1 Tax=Giesbergeria anulus TaxID=180197 RepID=A0A1H9KK11_9BURK|nr:hypothetical protein [Giesbergeria anulus]SEQ99501.1 hypothetical protein SAMN02982919_01582 [Giesbergeria anulus]